MELLKEEKLLRFKLKRRSANKYLSKKTSVVGPVRSDDDNDADTSDVDDDDSSYVSSGTPTITFAKKRSASSKMMKRQMLKKCITASSEPIQRSEADGRACTDDNDDCGSNHDDCDGAQSLNFTSGTDTIQFKRADDDCDVTQSLNFTSGTDTIQFKRADNDCCDDNDDVNDDECSSDEQSSDTADDAEYTTLDSVNGGPSDRVLRVRRADVNDSNKTSLAPVFDTGVARFRDTSTGVIRYHVQDDNAELSFSPKHVKHVHTGVVSVETLNRLRLRGKRFDDFKESKSVLAAIKPYPGASMSFDEYDRRIDGLGRAAESTVDHNVYVKITGVLEKLGLNRDTLKIKRSTIGDRLYEYSTNITNYPKIIKTETNHHKDITDYSLCYGYIPVTYSPEFQVLVLRFINYRKNCKCDYDLVEGELELLFLGYWRLETNDLKEYDPKVTRTTKKQILSYVISKIRKFLIVPELNETTKKLCNTIIKIIVHFSNFGDSKKIPALAFVHLKKILSVSCAPKTILKKN